MLYRLYRNGFCPCYGDCRNAKHERIAVEEALEFAANRLGAQLSSFDVSRVTCAAFIYVQAVFALDGWYRAKYHGEHWLRRYYRGGATAAERYVNLSYALTRWALNVLDPVASPDEYAPVFLHHFAPV
jgi:hypothetical protein